MRQPLHEDHLRGHGHDHNLRSAYLHVLADALTSMLAIVALITGKAFGWVWMDPVMGLVGAVLVGRWSLGLLRDTSAVLLAPYNLETVTREEIIERVREAGIVGQGGAAFPTAVKLSPPPDAIRVTGF